MARRYLQEVVSTEPNGPYFLGATCMGGMIALEMAQRLVRQGRAVAMLAFFDVPLRLPFSQHPRARERFYGRVRDPVRDAFRIFRWGMLRAAGRGCSQRQLSAYRRFVANMNSRANRRYQPVLYPGEITLFNTAEMKYPREDLRLRIRQYTSETRVISIPGKRSGLFVPPAVDELARHLREALEMAESRCFNSTISKVSLHT